MTVKRRDRRLPDYRKNATAGDDKNSYDYGVFNYVELFAAALYGGRRFKELSTGERNTLLGKFEHDLTDHMPIWIRLPLPR